MHNNYLLGVCAMHVHEGGRSPGIEAKCTGMFTMLFATQ